MTVACVDARSKPFSPKVQEIDPISLVLPERTHLLSSFSFSPYVYMLITVLHVMYFEFFFTIFSLPLDYLMGI